MCLKPMTMTGGPWVDACLAIVPLDEGINHRPVMARLAAAATMLPFVQCRGMDMWTWV